MVQMKTRTLRPAASTLQAALALAAGLAMTPQLASAEPLGTTTTYQGQLKNNGQIFSGQADTDFRYQLTIVDDSGSDEFVQAKVARKTKDNAFAIRTSSPNTEVSWQVSGVRHDAWAKANPRTIEFEKTGANKGKFLSPEAFGSPTASAITPFNGR